jgi:hypothetical protein
VWIVHKKVVEALKFRGLSGKIAQKKGFLMRLCQYFIIFVLGMSAVFADSSIPRTIQYQGRFLDAATNLPVQGTISRQITVNIRLLDSLGQAGTVLFSHTANSVTIRDGVFNIEIPVPANILFDQPYGIEVVVQGSGGGNVGLQKLRSVPYAFTAHNALQFGGRSASDFAAKDHVHDKLNQKSFTIDGTGTSLLPSDPQFSIINGDASIIFEVDASGNIRRVNEIRATGNIETTGKILVRDSTDTVVFEAGSDGTVRMAGDLYISGLSTVGSLVATGSSRMDDVQVNGKLIFGENALIQVPETGDNPVGKSHTLEDHATSDMMTKLQLLTSGGSADGLHTHSLAAGSITSDAIAENSISGAHIKDGAITNTEISASAAIDDTKLQSITRQIISSSALPSDVVLRNSSNTFGAGFWTENQKGRIDTTNYFDALRAKAMTIISTNTSEGMNFFELTNQSAQFKWTIDGSGALSFSRLSGSVYTPAIEVEVEGGETKVKLTGVTIEGEALITGREIKDGSIESRDIATGTITSDKIVDGAVTTAKIRDLSITTAKIANEAITAEKILNQSIESNHIAAGAVISTKIPDGSITAVKIQDNSIDGGKIQDDSITGSKIASYAITSQHIQNGAINADKIIDDGITHRTIKAGAVQNIHLAEEVLKDRLEPISVNMSSQVTPHLTLISSSTSSPAPMVLMKFNQAASSQVSNPAFLFQNSASEEGSRNMVSLNYNGSISLRSTNFSKIVTMDSSLFATMLGVPMGGVGAKCPANDTYDHVFSDKASTYGDGFCIKLITTAGTQLNYKEAVAACYNDNGGHLCRVSELYKACRDRQTDLISGSAETFMTSDFGYVGVADAYMTFTVITPGCVNTGDFTLGAAVLTDPNFYACCINP